MRASTEGNGAVDSVPASLEGGRGGGRSASPSRTPAAPASTNKPTATATVSRFTRRVYRLCSREPRGGRRAREYDAKSRAHHRRKDAGATGRRRDRRRT